ncbi:methyltransferase domain-containing protein [Alkalibaculum sp. M08DMB]|uniref:Methyltransferase domain-containing protein n=1 Tax=Alkalibaculum sporogenes TaxID=2655001 RepID=A0A6A7K5M3_9FIRM|nr:class I SAM-dependent methyltransferase [Alkalibaculum sporogenes]MPW24779.1 methyltransferase domain-containing protein [Alkalibaculum sporogenes]
MKCIICGGKDYKLVKKGVRDNPLINVVKCNYCSHHQLFPVPESHKINEIYDNDKQVKSIYEVIDVDAIRVKSITDTERRVELTKKYITSKESRVLDVGTGYGFFVNIMKRYGYDIEGLEIGNERRKIAERMCNKPIYSYNLLEDVPVAELLKYEVITMFQMLEHITDIELFLCNARELLQTQGKIIIEVPNLKDHMLSISEEYKEFFWQEAHISYFSPEMLNQVLTRSGFKDIHIFGVQRYSIENMFHWSLNKKPQIYSTSYNTADAFSWIDEYYKNELVKELKSDTIIAVAYK